jgi:hypothetical protein
VFSLCTNTQAVVSQSTSIAADGTANYHQIALQLAQTFADGSQQGLNIQRVEAFKSCVDLISRQEEREERRERAEREERREQAAREERERERKAKEDHEIRIKEAEFKHAELEARIKQSELEARVKEAEERTKQTEMETRVKEAELKAKAVEPVAAAGSKRRRSPPRSTPTTLASSVIDDEPLQPPPPKRRRPGPRPNPTAEWLSAAAGPPDVYYGYECLSQIVWREHAVAAGGSDTPPLPAAAFLAALRTAVTDLHGIGERSHIRVRPTESGPPLLYAAPDVIDNPVLRAAIRRAIWPATHSVCP